MLSRAFSPLPRCVSGTHSCHRLRAWREVTYVAPGWLLSLARARCQEWQGKPAASWPVRLLSHFREICEQSAVMRLTELVEGELFELPHTLSADTKQVADFFESMLMIGLQAIA